MQVKNSFGLTPDWLIKWREIDQPITKHSNAKPKTKTIIKLLSTLLLKTTLKASLFLEVHIHESKIILTYKNQAKVLLSLHTALTSAAQSRAILKKIRHLLFTVKIILFQMGEMGGGRVRPLY